MTQAVYTKLPDRAFIHVSGADRFSFLHGLITQDIELLKSQNLIYSCLLTPNGKFLFDFFIFKDGDDLVIDCEGGDRANTLLKRLSMFKLRSDVTLELKDDVDTWQIFNTNLSSPEFPKETVRGPDDSKFKDPRFDGYRTYSKPETIKEVNFDVWDAYRIKHEIPDGSRDMIPEKSFLHESQIILDHGISFTKGCYMGQELVSRMHHRGLVKKQLRRVDLNSMPEETELRSRCDSFGFGLALIRI